MDFLHKRVEEIKSTYHKSIRKYLKFTIQDAIFNEDFVTKNK